MSALGYTYEYSPKALLRVTGDDAFSFLQGQFSNELRQPAGSATYGLWLNQKGKVVADSVVLRLAENEFLLISTDSPAAVIQQRLQDYIVADDVTLADETGTMGGLIVGGEDGAKAMNALFGFIPATGKFGRSGEGFIFPGNLSAPKNYQVLGPDKMIAEWKQPLAAGGYAAIGTEAMQRMRISSGTPAIPQDLGPTDLPNEGGLDESALSYKKGCYLGQEVMARLKNLGQVRRRLQVVHGKGEPPKPMAPLYQAQKKIGEIRSVAVEPDGFVAMAMLSLINLNPAEGLSLLPDGPVVAWIGAHD